MFLALRELRSARGRFTLMAAVIALLSLLVVILSGLTAGLAAQSVGALDRLPSYRVALSAAPGQDGFATSTVTTRDVDDLARTPGVLEADAWGVTTDRIDEDAVAVLGAEPGSALAPHTLAPETLVADRSLGLEVGESVPIGGSTLRVAATVDGDLLNHLPAVWVPLDVWQSLPGSGGKDATAVALATDDTFDPAEAPDGLEILTRTDARAAVGSYAAENGSLTLIRGLLLAVSALVVGAFFTVWTIQRTADLAVLKAIGARTTYLLRDALAQAAIVLVVGAGTGALVGAAAGLAVSSKVPFVVDASTTLGPLLLLVVLGLAGAAAALRRVVNVDPLTALGGSR
ncbi:MULTISPECIES: FtsX-like permease family protein [Mumia]|uniref:FtsX-like permease family protein n=1 Tax=Mumia xiangluensis TaxID=1678900 RepID=A0ABW1QTS2_9ACTN|nr:MULTISPECIES: ABC transporter permease [Mumia]